MTHVFRSIDPSNNTLVSVREEHGPLDVEHALSQAAAAQTDWARTRLAARCAALNRLAAALRARADECARTMTSEMGKVAAEARAEVEKSAWVCEFYAEHAPAFLAPEAADAGAAHGSWVRFDPLGVVLAVMPWNFPLWQVLRFAAPALAAGNALILKHAPGVQGCAEDVLTAVRDAGLPAGLVQNLRLDLPAIPAVVADPRIAAVTLTGSSRAGAAVAAIAGQHLKKCVLELGGSDPFIVLPDADLAAAVAAGVRSRTLNAGQSCIAAKRFVVHRDVAEPFAERFTAAMAALTVGDPSDPGTDLGPLARGDLRDALHGQVVASTALGARVRCGGELPEGRGFYYPPTVLDRVAPGMPVVDEETFGPVAALLAADSVDDAVAIANDTPYGLGASLWTQDRALARALAPRIDAGAVYVNSMTFSDPRLPFGGVKASGYGRELGRFGLREFVNVKTVRVD